MKLFYSIFGLALMSASLLSAAPANPNCQCQNCKCTQEKHCGCFSMEGCKCSSQTSCCGESCSEKG